ncbi:MAG: hypothetical protein ABIG20_01050 [archaeon]
MARETVDKWKSKKFFDVVAPPLFRNAVIGQTIASDIRKVPGRIVMANYSTIIGDPNSRNNKVKLKFKITGVKGEKAETEFLGHALVQDYQRSLARRRTSKVYKNQVVTTKDGKRLRVKSIIVTTRQVKKSMKSELGKKLLEFMAEDAKQYNYNEFINDAVSGRISMRMKKGLSKFYPLRHAVVEKTEVIKEAVKAEPKVEEKPAEEKKE